MFAWIAFKNILADREGSSRGMETRDQKVTAYAFSKCLNMGSYYY
jgi:hypothetical protein